MRRVTLLALGLLGLVGTGCVGEKAERRAEYAQLRAAMEQQRAAALEAQTQQLRAVVALQSYMLLQAKVQADAAAAAQRLAAANDPEPTTPVPGPLLPKPLLDAQGSPLTATSYGPGGDIVSRIEAYIGRPLSGPERMQLGQIMRRPRAMDTQDPWRVVQ